MARLNDVSKVGAALGPALTSLWPLWPPHAFPIFRDDHNENSSVAVAHMRDQNNQGTGKERRGFHGALHGLTYYSCMKLSVVKLLGFPQGPSCFEQTL